MWRTEDLMDDAAFPAPPRDHAFVDFILDNMPDNFPDWPNHRFELRLRVILGPTGDLTMISRVKNVNTDGNPFTFKFAYHTYFSVSDIMATQVEGLETVDYVDYLNDHERFTEGPNPITFENEVDKVYLNTPDVITVRDRERRRTYTIHKDANLPEIVVWNPWDLEARRMSDFGDIEYREMVCVEAAAVESEITLNPDQEWTGTQRLSVEQF
ncbi:PREDICTED: putative glucose-6-phosphate 1-epimerase isoform X2 [Erythranthe guttata]|nr:PREDICTED: putative glucose-6-phosphate 1-epimerase isoform X2 [Erythranthe guttata]|eukprot:XP_012835420.1 PREDICTED: putative glucose-6-phosphate 1-epimerase isoform X2 [Erythranthe guttata]